MLLLQVPAAPRPTPSRPDPPHDKTQTGVKQSRPASCFNALSTRNRRYLCLWRWYSTTKTTVAVAVV